MYEEKFLSEEEADKIVKESDILLNHPELIGTNAQLIQLLELNLKAARMDDTEKYPPLLILAAFLIKIGGTFNMEPLEILESLRNQIDEWNNE